MRWRAREDAHGDFTTDRRVLLRSSLAVPVGVVAALVARGLLWLIAVITNLAYYQQLSSQLRPPGASHLGGLSVLVPIAGAVIIGLMARYGSEKIRGHGIPEAMEAILIGRSRIEARVALLKPLSSAVSIGTGGPFGAEGPIIMTGGALGSLFAQLFRLSSAERKTLLVAGAAAGMSAVFASPLAATLLAVELLLFEWKPRSFIPVAVASATAMALRAPLLGSGPLFEIPAHAPLGSSGLLLAVGLGVLAGFASSFLTSLVYGAEDLFGKLPVHWMWWPLLGGAVVGLGGLICPRALGIGTETIQDLLHGSVPDASLPGLLLTKMIIWSVALGSGTSGGVLAPLLLMGGCLGAMEARVLHLADPALWALIGMGAMMGGTMRTPFTAIVFMLELTRDVGTLPALLAACTASVLVTVLLMKRSILTEKVARKGHHVIREYAVSPLQRLFVRDVMSRDVPTLPAETTVAAVVGRLSRLEPAVSSTQAWPLTDAEGRLSGMVTRGDLLRSLESDPGGGQTVLQAGTDDPVVAHADEPLVEAVARMARHDVGRLPVVGRDDRRRLEGYLGRTGIIAAWTRGLDEEQRREAGSVGRGLRRALRQVRARWSRA